MKTRYPLLAASFLALSLLGSMAHASPADDLVTPDQVMSGLRRRVEMARSALRQVVDFSRDLDTATAACIAAEGLEDQCREMQRKAPLLENLERMYQEEFAKIVPYRKRLDELVSEELSEDCDAGWANQWVPFRSSNCHSNQERYRTLGRDADALIADLKKEAAAARTRTDASREQVAKGTELAEGYTTRQAELAEAAEKAREAAERQAELDREAEERARREAAERAREDAERDAEEDLLEDRQRAAVAQVVGSPGGPIDCLGGSGLFGTTMDCGPSDGSAPPPESVEPPSYVASDAIVDDSVLGVGTNVVTGDTLGHIAQKIRRQMGDTDIPLWETGGLVDLLAAANGLADPNRIDPQQGIRVPSLECLREAGEARSREVLAKCEKLARVNGVPDELEATTRLAREEIAAREAAGEEFTDEQKQEMIEDAAAVAANPASEFAGLGADGRPVEGTVVSKADFIAAQTQRFGSEYEAQITMVAEEAERRGYNDEERFQLLYRRMKEIHTDEY